MRTGLKRTSRRSVERRRSERRSGIRGMLERNPRQRKSERRRAIEAEILVPEQI